MSFDRGAPALWFVDITLDGETLRHCNAFEPVDFDGNTYDPLGDRFTAPADIDRAASLKSQKFKLTYDSSRQTDNTDPIGKILDANWKRRPIRVRYAVGDMDADGFDFSAPTIIADETGRIINLEDTLSAGDAPEIEMEVESGALIFLERRNQTRSPRNQRAAFPGDEFFDLARKLDGAELPWRTKKARNGKVQIVYDVDGEAPPRQMIIGRGMTRGTFVFGCTIGQQRKYWNQVFALADHECEALEQLYINGVDVLAGESALVHGVKKALSAFNSGGTRLWVTWYDGRHDQTADAYLISGTASQPLKWTSAHRGRGVSYVVIEHLWDSDNAESFSYEFVVKGAKIYQERLDTTAGGSGSHRLNDPDTWTWTDNPEEALRHYLRGRVVSPSSSYKWFGVGAPDAFLDPYSLYAYRAAHCDAAEPLQAGGTQTRYTANGWLSASDDHKKNIQKLADCMVADAVDEGGRISIRLSEPQTPVITLTDADLVDDGETVASPNARADDVVNRIEGQYNNPANKYSLEDYPAVENAAFEEIDGEQITGSWKQELENNEERAQRKATLYLNKQRRTVEFEETFGPAAAIVRPGDWVTRESALRGFPGGKLFIADEVRRFVDGSVRLILLEVDPGELVWDEASAVLTPASDPFVREVEPLAVPEITVSAITVSGGDVTIPAVRFAVATYDVAMGDEVLCEFGIWNGLSGGSAAIVGASDYVKIPGNFQTFDALKGLLPGTGYAFRFRARDGEKLSAWSDFETLTTTGTYQAGRSAIADSIVGQGWGATASQAEADNTFVPNGVNQLVDHDFRFGSTYWRALSNSGGSVATADAETAGVRRRTITGTGITVGGSIQFDSFPDRARFACKAGDLVEASAYVSQSNCSLVRIYIQPYNSAGTALTASSFGDFTPGAGVAQLSDFTRISKLAVMPANTAYCFVGIRGVASTSAPVLHVAKPMLAVANAGQTAPTPWNPGLAYTPGADPTAANTAAAIEGQGWGATASEADVSNDQLRPEIWADVARAWTWSTGTADGWTFNSCTPSYPAGGGVLITEPASPANPDSFIQSEALTVDGSVYNKILVDLECVSGAGGVNDLSLYWTTSGHGYSGSYRDLPRNAAAFTNGERRILVYDMDTATAGAADWNSNTITRIRFDLPQLANAVYRVHSIRILRATTAEAQRLLATIDEGADVTAANTAAAIAGQQWGATATQTQVDNTYPLSRMPQGLARNGNFAEPFSGSAVPPGWTNWATGAGTFSPVPGETGKYALYHSVAAGVSYAGAYQILNIAAGARYVLEAEVRRQGGTFAPSGVYLDWRDGANNSLLVDTIPFGTTPNTSGETTIYPDGVKRWEKIVTAPAGSVTAVLYYMTNYNGFGSVAAATQIVWKLCDLRPLSLVGQLGADVTSGNTAAAIAGQGNQATANAARGTTAARPASPPNLSWYANTTTNTLQLYITGSGWLDVASLSTAVQTRGKILGPAALNVSNTGTWNVVAQVDLTSIPAGGVIQVPYVSVIGQSQNGISVGAGWQWRLCEAPTASPSSKTVIKSGTMTCTAGGSLGGGLYDPPVFDPVNQPSQSLVTLTNSGNVRYTIEVYRASGSSVVGLTAEVNFIINPAA